MGTRTWKVTIKERTIQMKLAKARAEALTSRIKEATVNLPQYTRELYTSSFDGKDHSSTTMVLFGKGQAPILNPAAWQAESDAALDKWASNLITEANLTEAVSDFRAIYDKHLPILDKRRNAEQLAAERREHEELEAARKAKDKAELEAFLSKFSTGPDAERIEVPSGKMAIYLETVYDNSDGMTDYYDPHRQAGADLLLAIVPKQAKTQALARMAVGRYPDLAGVGFSWHTENYSMGKGNYLEATDSWVDVPQPGAEEPRSCRYTVKFNEYGGKFYPYKGFPGTASQSAQAEASAPISNAAATIARNTAKDGIEIRFSERPADSIISRLKANRWRWSRFSKCWYTRYSTQAEAFAAEIVKLLQPETEAPPAEAIAIPPAEASSDLAAEVFENRPAEEDEETLTAEDMSAITGQEWTEEAMEQFRACC